MTCDNVLIILNIFCEHKPVPACYLECAVVFQCLNPLLILYAILTGEETDGMWTKNVPKAEDISLSFRKS